MQDSSLHIFSQRLNLVARNNFLNQRGYSAGDQITGADSWIKAFTSYAKQGKRNKNNITSLGYNAHLGGIAIGFDKELSNNYWAGLGFSFAESLIKTRDILSHKTKVKNYQTTFYSSFSPQKYSDNCVTPLFHKNKYLPY